MDMDIDMDVPHRHHGGSGHGNYDSTNNHDYGYAQPHYTNVQWQRSQLQAQESPGYGIQHSAIHFGYPNLTPPTQPQAITKATVIVDTNVLLDYLMVIQKFVADIEQAEWPSVVVIPSAVISELDWQKNTRKSISWSARAASRWILEKLKEDKEAKVLRVQASNETLEGSGSKGLQPDRNTENDISIRDCCRYFRQNTRDPVFLLSGDINLSIRGESDDIQTLEPRKDWSSLAIASSIFGSDACRGFDGYIQSQMRPGRTSAHIQSSTGAVVVDRMNIDIEHSREWIPSHVLDDLHLQLVDHFTILLKELVERISPEVVQSAGRNGASLSIHAGVLTKSFEGWTAADCLEHLATLRKMPGSRALRLESFMSKPHCKDTNARGRRRGQDWTRVQWDTGIQMLERVGKVFEDQAIGESVDLLKIAVEDYFRLPT